MDGGPNKKFSYKPRAGLIEFSLKNCKMTAYKVNQTIDPVPNYSSMLCRCIVGNLDAPRCCRLAAVCGPVLIINQYRPRDRRKPLWPAGLDFDIRASSYPRIKSFIAFYQLVPFNFMSNSKLNIPLRLLNQSSKYGIVDMDQYRQNYATHFSHALLVWRRRSSSLFFNNE